MNEQEFDIILDNDESLIKTIKPNKKRYITINIIFVSIFVLLLIGALIAIGLAAFFDDEVEGPGVLICFSSIAGLVLIIAIIDFISAFVMYRKTTYAITNKRVIIKSGFIGNDFKSLDLNTIGAVSVRVDFLDKLIKPINSGTIDFGSMSMPMGGGASGRGGNEFFSFKHVDDPYELYKEVKEYIEQAKNSK